MRYKPAAAAPEVPVSTWLAMSLLLDATSVAHAQPIPVVEGGIEIAAPGERTSFDIEVFVRFDGNLYLDDEIVMDTELPASLQAMRQANPNARVVISADTDAPHGRVIEVLKIAEGAGIGRVALQIDGVETERVSDPLFPGNAALGDAPVTQLDDGLTKKQLRDLKPKRHKFPQNPYGSTDFTAYTVEWGETKLGLAGIHYGIAPRTQVGTVPILDAVGILNANIKANVMREGPLDGALLTNVYYVPVLGLVNRFAPPDLTAGIIDDSLENTFITVFGFGMASSLQLAKPWSIHGALTYNRITGQANFDFNDLPTIIIPGSENEIGGDLNVVPRLVGEAFNFKFASDLRFNRRDSLIFQFQTPLYANARGALSADLDGFPEEFKDFDIGVSYDVWLPIAEAYRVSLSWQFSWKHVDLRIGGGWAPTAIQPAWLLQACDLSYRFGGKTRREESDIKRGYRDNKKDLEKGGGDALPTTEEEKK